jgi:di/tricarboxylate transporter
LGFQLATAFLSMWMSNSATTVMMLPIVEAVIMELEICEQRTKRCISTEKETSVEVEPSAMVVGTSKRPSMSDQDLIEVYFTFLYLKQSLSAFRNRSKYRRT